MCVVSVLCRHTCATAHTWKSEHRFGSWFSAPRVQIELGTAAPPATEPPCLYLSLSSFLSISQVLNEYFHNVCELDLVFNFYKVGCG